MGVCASCLGLNRGPAQESTDSEALLYHDSTQPQYGAIGSGTAVPGPDPEDLRREREALELICAQTSNQLIDVLHHAPGSKIVNDYSVLLNKHFPSRSGTSSPTADDEAVWLSNTQDTERELWAEVKGLSQGRLVLTLNTPPQHNGVAAR